MSKNASVTVALPRWRWILSRALWLLAAAWFLLLLAWLALHWLILPRLDDWRGPIEQRAGAVLGVPVRIGEIVVRSSGWVPALELRDVVIHDAESRPALILPRVAASVSPRSLLSLEPRFEQLLIEGAKLEVRRDELGRIFVAGIDIGTGGGDGSAADWFFRQGEFAIRGGTVRWSDDKRLAPPLVLNDVEMVVRNGLRQHAVRLDATPAADWGERFSLRGRFVQPLLARPSDWRRWSGSVYAELPRASLSELRRHVNLPFELSEGDGALRAWAELDEGELRSATADVALRAVALRLAPQVEPLGFEQVSGRISIARDRRGGRIDVQRLGFVTGDGLRWPEGDLSLRWRQREGQGLDGGEFSAQQLDLALIARVASRVPLGEPLRQLLDGLQPQGLVTGLTAQWEGALDAPRRYQAKGLISGLTLAGKAAAEPGAVGRPGLRNATLRLSASETGGEAQLGLDSGALELPGVLDPASLAFDRLDASLAWKIEPRVGAEPTVRLQVKDARFRNADAQGELTATWSTGAGTGFARGGRYPGALELNAKIGRAQADRVARYLPLGIPEATRSYVARAVQGGVLAGGTIRLRGDLWDFPFRQARSAAEGEFRIDARVEDLVFAYVPDLPALGAEPAWTSPWPVMTRLSGELLIDRGALEFRQARAQLGGIQWEALAGGIASLADQPVLRLAGTGRGPVGDMLRFVDATPVAGWTDHTLARAVAEGPGEMQLALILPLQQLERSRVSGSLRLAGNDVRLTPTAPLLAAARGRLDFTEHGFSLVGASARVLGSDVAFEGGSQADGSLRFDASGTVTAEVLRRSSDSPPLARLAGVLSGQAAWRATVAVAQGRIETELTSSLAGLAIDAPAPLGKPAETALPLRVHSAVAADRASDSLRVELGSLITAQLQRDLSGDAPRLLRGGVGVNEAAPMPETGLAAAVNLPLLRWDDWAAFARRVAGPDAGADAVGSFVPDRIALQAQELVVGGRRLDRVVAGLTHDGDLWRVNVDAAQLDGYVEYRPSGAAGPGRLLARLARLSVPRSEMEQVESLLDTRATVVPALDIVVGDFELRGKKLGRLEVEAVNRGESGAGDGGREWRLSKLNLTMPEARLVADGTWARRRAAMNFRLEVADSGVLLERLGTPAALRGGKGELRGAVSWTGSPLAIDYPSLNGQVGVALDSGQFLKADPGAVRLLGVLSLQSLPRRLALDFRDVFQEGFAFDNITGDVTIDRGVAHTNNLRMRGLQAAVLMEGRADIGAETQDLRVVVVPEINAGTASLAWAAINPAVGIGTFLAQWLLRRPLAAANTREFHVSGPWADPKVEAVERTPGEVAPDVDAPLPPAPARERTPNPAVTKEPP